MGRRCRLESNLGGKKRIYGAKKREKKRRRGENKRGRRGKKRSGEKLRQTKQLWSICSLSENPCEVKKGWKALTKHQTRSKSNPIQTRNEFACYQDSCFSANFHLPIRTICSLACAPVPLVPGTWIITELIQNTGKPVRSFPPFHGKGSKKEATLATAGLSHDYGQR